MGSESGPIQRASSWLTDDLLGIDESSNQYGTDTTGGTNPQTAPASGSAESVAASAPGVTVPTPMTPAAPTPAATVINNNINPSPAPATPSTFGTAPQSTAPVIGTDTQKKSGTPSTFLGAGATPARQRVAGSFGFDQKNTGTKTLIGS